MAEVLAGVAAGLAVAAASVAFYRRGLADGRRRAQPSEATGESQSALMKKYEAIMDYDLYGERV